MNQFKSTTFFLEISRDVLLNLLKTVLTKFAIKKNIFLVTQFIKKTPANELNQTICQLIIAEDLIFSLPCL